ncbi:MAG: ABC transporter, partial [Neisseriaceae bacterium]|nr:ABC transporter [Neisseriaceae bacterium]
MNLWQLFKKLYQVVKPYHWLVIATLLLTLISSLTAQVNAITLQWAVDSINHLMEDNSHTTRGWRILMIISIILIGK